VSLEHRVDGGISEDTVQQMLLLAERLRESHGGELDDEAIVAVAEATGAPVDYVRIAVARRGETEKQTLTKKLRSTYLSLDPDERSWVASAGIGAIVGLMTALDARTGSASYGLFGIFMILAVVLGMANISLSRDSRLATISGAVLGAIAFIAHSFFGLLLQARFQVSPWALIPITGLAAVLGFLTHSVVSRNRKSLGLKDATAERHDLLRQLVDLQEKLRSGEQAMTFLSVDIVGSTRLKGGVDPLSVEFTFNEYHQFVEQATARYGGRVHSTAGDGVTCVFDQPQQAFAAAKNMQVGIIELNTFRNKLGSPIVLRCGIHAGAVVAPDARDVTSVNFAHVIDIAAHLQKVCPPGGIVVSEAAAIHIPGGPVKIGDEKVQAQEVSGYIWRPRVLNVHAAASVPPPLPKNA
jgi:class 3 adenylate cyclase